METKFTLSSCGEGNVQKVTGCEVCKLCFHCKKSDNGNQGTLKFSTEIGRLFRKFFNPGMYDVSRHRAGCRLEG